jgi:gliding motility-associated-like protein
VLYLPLNNNFINNGTGQFTMNMTEASFVNSTNGNGLKFDGYNDYLQLSPTVYLNGDFTIVAWVGFNDLNKSQTIFSVRDQCLSSNKGYSIAQIGINENDIPGLSYQVNTHKNCAGNYSGDRYSSPSIEFEYLREKMVAVTVNNNSSEYRDIKFFGDCLNFNTSMPVNSTTDTIFNAGIDFITTIGAASNVEGQYHSVKGIVDEFRLYNRVLTDRDIKDIYHSTRPLHMYVHFYDKCTGDSASIRLHNTESDVVYQLKDITNNQFASEPKNGNCQHLIFTTELLTDTVSFQIIATNIYSGCSIALDTVITLKPLNMVSRLDTTVFLCFGDSVWFDSSFIKEAGTYADTIFLEQECNSIINMTVVPKFLPSMSLITDTIMCSGRMLTLIAETPESTYTWQDNSHEPFLTIRETGDYWVDVRNRCGVVRDTVSVFFRDCSCDFLIPNAFTPNSDGLNDYFNIIVDCLLNEYRLIILNQWGQPVFESNNPDDSWTGLINGRDCPAGIYFWQFYYRNYEFEESGQKNGCLTLIR